MENIKTPTPGAWGALFDLDGVLVDTEGIYTDFWHNVDVRFPTGVERFEHVIKGNTLSAILDRYFPDARVQSQILKSLKEHEQSMEYRFFDGVADFLEQLRRAGIPSAIVTSSNPAKMEHLFRSLPSLRALVDVVITEGDVSRSKPDPEGYNIAAARLGIAPQRCVVFEDSLAGVEAGRRAGGKVIGIATTNTAEALAPWSDKVVATVGALTVGQVARMFT